MGYHYTSRMKGAIYIDADGKEKPFYMGCSGSGIGRTMATIVEKYHDERGIIWPEEVAPFLVHIIEIKGSAKVKKEAQNLYKILQENNIEVLYDDREDKTPGEKFAEADLIGIPYRLVVSEKTLAKGSVELKKRDSKKIEFVKIKQVLKIFK